MNKMNVYMLSVKSGLGVESVLRRLNCRVILILPRFLPRRLSDSYNLGQNKMEQKCPLSPKSRMKVREGQNAPFSHH